MAFNHVLDAGGTWDEGEAELRRTYPHWVEHAAAYRANFPSVDGRRDARARWSIDHAS